MGDRATLLFTETVGATEIPLAAFYTHGHATKLEEILRPIVTTCHIDDYDHKSDASWSRVVMRIIGILRDRLNDDLNFFPPSLVLEGKPYDAHYRYTIGLDKHHIPVVKYVDAFEKIAGMRDR